MESPPIAPEKGGPLIAPDKGAAPMIPQPMIREKGVVPMIPSSDGRQPSSGGPENGAAPQPPLPTPQPEAPQKGKQQWAKQQPQVTVLKGPSSMQRNSQVQQGASKYAAQDKQSTYMSGYGAGAGRASTKKGGYGGGPPSQLK
ncbi:unnamed protein product, partial [Amoebophrya sp. A25]|eukprot:GSA25T00004401001.1